MNTGQLVYLGMALVAFATFIVVLAGTYAYVWLGERRIRREAGPRVLEGEAKLPAQGPAPERDASTPEARVLAAAD